MSGTGQWDPDDQRIGSLDPKIISEVRGGAHTH